MIAIVVLAFDEDLPDGAADVTSDAMPPMGQAVADVADGEPDAANVVLVGDRDTQPVVNAGTLYQ